MKKSKIIIVGPLPPPYTGMSVVNKLILDSSLNKEFEVIHLDTTDKRAIRNMGKLDVMNIFLGLKHSLKFVWLCLRKKPDLVYLPISQNFLGYLRDIFFLIPARILKIKAMIHLHGGYFRNFYEDSGGLGKRIIRFTLKGISAAIVLGESLKYIFKDLVPEERIFVISNGVEDYLDTSLKEPSKNNSFKILFLSNFLREKGVFDILKVAPQIISSYPNAKFIFAGEWNNKKDEKEVKNLVKQSGSEANIEFAGVAATAEKRKLLNEASLFVLPTFYPFEGQPLVILEAMSAGLPVISTKKGAIFETIINQENGFLIESRDSAQMIKSIIAMVSNPDLAQKMGERSREIYLKKYTKDIFINNLSNLFRQISQEVIIEKAKAFTRQESKVLILGHLAPPQEGTAKLTEAIAKSPYLNDNFQMKFLPLFKSISVTDRGKFGLANVSYNTINIFNYIWQIVEFRPQLIYMPLAQNRFGFFRDSLFIVVGKALRKKMYIHFHGGSFKLFYEKQRNIFKKYIRFVLKHIDRLILLARKFKEQFVPFIEAEKIIFLYNCVSDFPFTFIKNEKSSPERKTARVLFIGYLSKAKGALDLVKAIPQVIANFKNPLEFVLCGQPVDIERNIVFIPEPHFGYSRIKDFIKQENLYRYVKIYPEVVGQEKNDMFLGADMFVFPSYSEGCGLVVLEAMTFGLPVITTPVGALEEMLEENRNCLFVKPGDVSSLSEKILFLLNNPQLAKQMGQANKQLIREKYNPDVFLHKIADVWRLREARN